MARKKNSGEPSRSSQGQEMIKIKALISKPSAKENVNYNVPVRLLPGDGSIKDRAKPVANCAPEVVNGLEVVEHIKSEAISNLRIFRCKYQNCSFPEFKKLFEVIDQILSGQEKSRSPKKSK